MLKTLVLMLPLCAAGSVWGSSALVAGWENWFNADEGPASRMDGVDASYQCSDLWSIHSTGASADGTFGNYAAVPPAEGLTDALQDGQRLPNGSAGSHVFTVTDTSGTARTLSFFHFDTASLRKSSSREWKLEVLSGDLTAGLAAEGTVPEPASGGILDWHNVDVDLKRLPDSVLDANGTVVFRLSFSGGTEGQSGHHQMLDNVGISQAAAPEPETLGLLSAGGIGLLLLGLRFTRNR